MREPGAVMEVENRCQSLTRLEIHVDLAAAVSLKMLSPAAGRNRRDGHELTSG
jgi:hypothetical protein